MKRFLKSFRNQKGFTLIELLIVVAILGILAAVVLPNVSGFLSTGNLAAANSEVAAVKTASAAYYAGGGTFPSTSGAYTAYLDRAPKATYGFTTVGMVSTAAGYWDAAPNNFIFSTTNQTWSK